MYVDYQVASATFTRPTDTTAYAIGDLVANSTTAGSVVPLTFNVAVFPGAGISVARARLRKSTTVVTLASFRLHLFTVTPATVTNGDNGAFSVSGSADYVGGLNLDLQAAGNGQVFTDGVTGFGVHRVGGADSMFKIASSGKSIFGFLEALAAYTPGNAEVFAVTLELVRYS